MTAPTVSSEAAVTTRFAAARGRTSSTILRVAQGVYPDAGVDLLAGGPGDDRLRARDQVRRNDALNGGAGVDACSADPGDAVSGCRP